VKALAGKVKVEALLKVRFKSVRLAEAVVSAVAPDNKPTPKGLKVKAWRQKQNLLGLIQCSRGVETFVATLDDLLASIQTAWKTLEVVGDGKNQNEA